MKHLNLVLLMLVACIQTSLAQKIELINSGEIIKNAIALNDSGLYKQALAEYNKVSRSDTNYVRSLYERALTCQADSQYTLAIKYAQEALALKEDRDYEPELYNVYGNSLDDMGKPEEAIKVFDAGIAKYPAYSLLYFNKGVAFTVLKRYPDAEVWFQKTLMVSPYMYSAHYQLGLAALHQGKLMQSFLSALAYLLVNPEGKYYSKSLALLNSISKGTDEVLEYKNKRTVSPPANYQEIEDIVLSKIALDKAYKPMTSLDDPILRQIQVIFEKLEYDAQDNDFWMQYYVPYFKKVFKEGKFELFVNHTFSNVNLPAIQAYNKKNKKELQAFTEDAASYFSLIRATRELTFTKREAITNRYIIESGSLVGKGVLEDNGKKLTGKWVLNYAPGNVKGTGEYSAAGQREGKWVFYYPSGMLKAQETYAGGKLQGSQDYYFENGNPSSHENYVNGELEGISTSYYYAGNKRSVVIYKAGKKDGEERNFYSNGALLSTYIYTNGQLNGISREYFKSGPLKETEQYSLGKADGPYRSFHENGSASVEGQFVKDNAQGEWKYFYDSGKIKEKRTYLNNTEEGPQITYFENGNTDASSISKKGKKNGETVYYREDGKVLAKYLYDNGALKSVKYFDRSGAELSTSHLKENLLHVNSYNSDGAKKAHLIFDQKGNLTGTDTVFYPSGKISQINGYKDGEFDGMTTSYYLNGNKKNEVNMTAGKDDGYYTAYYPNGKVETEGWMVNGESQGEWHYYDELGRITTISNFLDNDLNGYKEEFLPNGQKSIEQKYHRGWLEKMIQYDNTGKVLTVDTFPKVTGKFVLYHPGGKLMAEGYYKNGDFDGAYKTYYFDGSPESVFYYNNGLKDSTYTAYYYGGTKRNEGHYKGGDKNGIWKAYDENGKLASTTPYVGDEINGEVTYYFPAGGKDFVSRYKDGDLDGIAEKYDPDGSLAYQVKFEEGKAKAYSYLGKDGKLVPFIPIATVNGTLKAYFANGKPSRESYYSDGIKNGQDIVYYTNGQQRSVDGVAYGISEGSDKEYYPDGKLKMEYNYQNDNITGVAKDYNSKGVLQKEISYDNGQYHGPAKYYDENGKLVKTMLYVYGTLISVKNEK